MADPELITVQVVYALPERQWLWSLQVAADSTVAQAIAQSPFPQRFPQVQPQSRQVGIFGKPCELNHALREGDRIEIYRPLLCDPKEVRRQRALRG